MINNKVECDIIFYTVKLEGKYLYGITDNLAAICIKIHSEDFFGKNYFHLRENKFRTKSKSRIINLMVTIYINF